jgi:glycosyltransferase involved in cell wall biosynthesis
MALRVLVVAHWYPSYDAPLHAPFIVDHARVAQSLGAEVAVIAPELIAHSSTESRAARADAARTLWMPGPDPAPAFSRPRSWGIPGVPVARPPVFAAHPRVARRLVERYAEVLEPFGSALHRRWPFDVIHAHVGVPDGIAAMRLAERLDVPLIVTEHATTTLRDLEDPGVCGLYREMATRHHLVAVSRFLRDDLAACLEIDPNLIEVIPNVVDVDAFAPGPLGGRHRDELLWVGSRRASKGIERLLRAFALVRGGAPNARLRLIGWPGEPSEEAAWSALATELGIADAVTFEPPMVRAGVGEAMSRAWVFVHPSAIETFGVVAAEAIATGLPVAATPSGAVDELLEGEGALGVVAEDATPEALALAVRQLMDRREQLGPADLHAVARTRWSATAVADKTGRLHAHVLGGSGAVTRDVSANPPFFAQDRAVHVLPVVVALRPSGKLGRMHLLAAGLRRQLTIVSLPATPMPEEVDVVRHRGGAPWTPGGGPSSLRARGRAILHRVGAFRGSRAGRPAGAGPDDLPGLIRRCWRGMPGPGHAGEPLVLPLTAADVLAVGAEGRAGVRFTPGGLRWLADRYDERAVAARNEVTSDRPARTRVPGGADPPGA